MACTDIDKPLADNYGHSYNNEIDRYIRNPDNMLASLSDLIPANPGKVMAGIGLQFSGYFLMGTAGLVVWMEGPIGLFDPGIGGMSYIGGFAWWEGTQLIYQGYSELPSKGK